MIEFLYLGKHTVFVYIAYLFSIVVLLLCYLKKKYFFFKFNKVLEWGERKKHHFYNFDKESLNASIV